MQTIVIFAPFVNNATGTRLSWGGNLTYHASLVIRETQITRSTSKNVDHLGQFPHLEDGTIDEMLIHCDNLFRDSLAHEERYNLWLQRLRFLQGGFHNTLRWWKISVENTVPNLLDSIQTSYAKVKKPFPSTSNTLKAKMCHVQANHSIMLNKDSPKWRERFSLWRESERLFYLLL